MNKKTIGVLGGLLLLGAVSYYLANRAPTGQAARRFDPSAPVPVGAARVASGDIDVVVRALGTVTARNTTVVKPRVDGQLLKIHFKEGQFVQEGDVLAEIDPRPYQAQLDQARGQLARDEALLKNAKIDRDRYVTLLAQDSIARQQVDTQEALVAQYQGVVQADRGLVDNARLNLDFTRIRAPLSGRLGLRLVDAGNMVRASDTTGVVVITQTRPITALFSIAADQIGEVVRASRAGETLRVEAWDREGKARLATGRLLSLDNLIDTTTGTVKLKAEFDNEDHSLFPNQFVTIRLHVRTRRAATLIPVAAVSRGSVGAFVYVIDPREKKVALRPVALSHATDREVAVDQGVVPGEIVVVSGADRLRQNSPVEFSLPDGDAPSPDRPAPSGEAKAPQAEPQNPAPDGDKIDSPRSDPAKKPANKRPANARQPRP